jgi:hypothetical protein
MREVSREERQGAKVREGFIPTSCGRCDRWCAGVTRWASLVALGGSLSCTTDNRLAAASVAGKDGAADAIDAESADRKLAAPTELPLAFSSRTVDLKLGFGETSSAEIRLIGKLAAAARLSVETIDPPGPEVMVLPADGTRPQGLRVTVVGTRVGQRAGQVTLGTGLDDPSKITILYSWKVVGSLTVDPTNPFIDLRAPPPAGVAVHVTSSRQDFRLDKAQIVEGPFQATTVRDEAPGRYTVNVTVSDQGSSDSPRGSLGTLRLLSNDPAEPRKDIQVFALGPLGRGTPGR